MTFDKNYGSTETSARLDSVQDDLTIQSVDASRRNRNGKKRERQKRLSPSTQQNESTQTSTEILLSARPDGALCNSTYIIEPVAFIQNLASSIMGVF